MYKRGEGKLTIETGLLLTVFSLVIGVMGYQLNKKNQQISLQRDIKKEATSEAEVKVTLAHISKGVDDIKVDMRATKEQMNGFSRDLVRVEESVKSAHKRIDKWEGKSHEN